LTYCNIIYELGQVRTTVFTKLNLEATSICAWNQAESYRVRQLTGANMYDR